MGFFSSIGSAISGAISGACSMVSSAFSSIGGALGNIASMAASALKIAAPFIDSIVKAIESVGVMLGILTPEDNSEELGAKAMMAEKKPEDFDSTAEYIEYLRNDVKLDKEKLKNADESTKLASKYVGISLTSKAIEEKLDANIPMEFWKEVAIQNLKAKEITSTIESYKRNNLDTAEYGTYLNGDMKIADKKEHSNAISEAYRELEPSLTSEQIDEKISELKKSSHE